MFILSHDYFNLEFPFKLAWYYSALSVLGSSTDDALSKILSDSDILFRTAFVASNPQLEL